MRTIGFVLAALLGLAACSSDDSGSGGGGGAGTGGSGVGGTGGAQASCAEPSQLVSLGSGSMIEDTTIDGDTLYFTVNSFQGDDKIMSVPTAGGEPTEVTKVGSNPFSVATDSDYVYWVTASDLWKVSKSGGAPARVATAANASSQTRKLAVDDTYVYFVATGLQRLDKTASEATSPDYEELAAESPNALVLAGDTIYYTTDEDVMKVPKAGGTAVTLATGFDSLTSLAVCGGFVVFVDGTRLYKVPVAGGTATQVGESFDSTSFPAIGCDDEYIYFAAGYFKTNRVPLDGTAHEEFACDGGTQMSMNATSVYWIGYIMSDINTRAK